LPVSPDCPFWVCPFAFLCCVSCTQCCLYHRIVHSGFAPLLFSVVCLVPNVACITRLDNPVIQATLGTRHTTEKSKRANPEWTIWWYRQHWVQDTQQRKAKGQTQNGQYGDTGNIGPNVACITGLSILGLPLCFSLLCVLYPMLPVSPDCPFWVCPFAFLCCVSCTQCCLYHHTGNIGYKTHNREKQRGKPRMDNLVIQAPLGTRHTTEKMSCTQCCLYHQIVHSGLAPLIFSVVCLVLNVACITRLSILGLPLWFSLLCVLYPMVPVSLDCPFWVCPFAFLCCVSCKPRMDNLVIQAPLGTRHTTEKIKGANPEWTIWWYRQHWVQDTQQRKSKGQTQNGQSTQCCLYHRIVHSWFAPLLFSVVCLLPNVACITGLSILGLPLWFVDIITIVIFSKK
jgi:hypothetical protein